MKFDEFEVLDFARPGAKATETFTVSEGPVVGPNGPFSHTLEPVLRRHGLPTRLYKGVIEAIAEHTVKTPSASWLQMDCLTHHRIILLLFVGSNTQYASRDYRHTASVTHECLMLH